jgi:polyhydroxybutyrate depolymerase
VNRPRRLALAGGGAAVTAVALVLLFIATGLTSPSASPASTATGRAAVAHRGDRLSRADRLGRSARGGRGRHRDHHVPSWKEPSPKEVLDSVGRLPAGEVATVHVLSIDGRQRYYLEIAPDSDLGVAPHSLPVYLLLHGHHMTPVDIEHLTDFPEKAGRAVLVYPAGIGESWNAGGCCWYAHAHHVNDVGFIAAVVKQVLAADESASRHHIYVVGFSNGGRMAYRLACDLPGTFAGFAAVEAVPVITCDHLDPLDIEIVARARDPLLRFGHEHPLTLQGYREPTVTEAVTEWRTLDGCQTTPEQQRKGTTEITTWEHCRDGTSVQYVLYAGAGHLWTWSHPPNPAATDLILARLGGSVSWSG